MFASPSLPSSTRAAIFSATWGVSIAYLVLMSTALAGLQLPALGMKGLVLAVAAVILAKYAKAHPDQAEVKAALRINKLQAVVVVLTEVLALGAALLGAALLGGASAQGVSQRGAALAGMVLLASVVVHLVIGVRGTRQLNQLRQAATAQETVAPAEPVSAAGTGVNDAQPPV